MNKQTSLYNSILMRLSSIAPLFAKNLLDSAIKKRGKSPDTVTAIDLLDILKNEINVKISKDKVAVDALLQSASGFFISDLNGEIIYIDPYVKKIITANNLDINSLKNEFIRVGLSLNSTKVVSSMNTRQISLSGGDLTYEVMTVPFLDTVLNVIGTTTTIREVTLRYMLEEEVMEQNKKLSMEIKQRQQVEEDLKVKQAQLIQSSRLAGLGEMASGISHEINNPLMIVLGGLQLLESSVKNGKADIEFIHSSLIKIKNGATRIKDIIKAMRALSNGHGGQDLKIQPLADVLNDVKAICTDKFKNAAIDLSFDNQIPEAKLKGNFVTLGQLFINFLNNSFDEMNKYSEKWVKVIVEKADNNIKISIIDSGKGIPLEVQEKIFDPFFTTKEIGKGVGVGMSIAKNIIEAHHGKILIDSLNPNTKFDIYLPLAE